MTARNFFLFGLRLLWFSAAGGGLPTPGTTARGPRTALGARQPPSRPRDHQLCRFHWPHRRRSTPSTWSRVTGYLVKEPFKEGAEVKTGELLFEVDPRPYQAQYDQAVGQVNLYKAQLARPGDARPATSNWPAPRQARSAPSSSIRTAPRPPKPRPRSTPREASLETYKLNLDFCRVTSPIDGQVSRYYLTLGNLVTQDQTLLTTVVSLDPMYAYFDVDEPTVLRVRRAINQGLIKPYGAGHIPVLMGLQGEDGFPRKGFLDFVNNQVNPATGSILVRGVFDNPLPPGGRRLLQPGMFVRIRLPIGQPHPALLVIDRAIGSDQGLKFVYLVNAEGKVEYRRIETGPLQSDGLRVVTKGLDEKDLVVTSGLQQVHPGMAVKTELMAMPVFNGQQPELGAGALPAGALPGGPAVKGAPANGEPANSAPPAKSGSLLPERSDTR